MFSSVTDKTLIRDEIHGKMLNDIKELAMMLVKDENSAAENRKKVIKALEFIHEFDMNDEFEIDGKAEEFLDAASYQVCCDILDCIKSALDSPVMNKLHIIERMVAKFEWRRRTPLVKNDFDLLKRCRENLYYQMKKTFWVLATQSEWRDKQAKDDFIKASRMMSMKAFEIVDEAQRRELLQQAGQELDAMKGKKTEGTGGENRALPSP